MTLFGIERVMQSAALDEEPEALHFPIPLAEEIYPLTGYLYCDTNIDICHHQNSRIDDKTHKNFKTHRFQTCVEILEVDREEITFCPNFGYYHAVVHYGMRQ